MKILERKPKDSHLDSYISKTTFTPGLFFESGKPSVCKDRLLPHAPLNYAVVLWLVQLFELSRGAPGAATYS